MKDFKILVFRFFLVVVWLGIIGAYLSLGRLGNYFKPGSSINIFCWPMLLDVDYVHQFEKETGIKVHISYYENNDELFTKLQATHGVGYDLIIPSDYMVGLLSNNNLIKKIDKNRIACWQQLDQRLLNLYCDPGNEYTIPYFWAPYGLGLDTRYFKEDISQVSWKLIFDPKHSPRAIGMPDAAREIISLATIYLFGPEKKEFSDADIMAIEQLLSSQKARVAAYTENGAPQLLLSQTCPVVVAMGPDILRISKFNPHIQFKIPEEGSFLVVDLLAISSASCKDDLIYKFINYLFQDNVIKHHLERYGMCPAIRYLQSGKSGCPTDEEFRRLNFFTIHSDNSLLNTLWLNVMAH